MTLQEFRLPDLGEGLTEADLVSWSVAVGDQVELNQTIAEVETAKALVELPSPYAGTVSALLAEPGATVLVGTPIIRIATEGDEAPERQEVLVGYGPGAAAESRRGKRLISVVETPSAEGGRPDAKPSARKLARELGVDLAAVASTGPVTVEDVRAQAVPATANDCETRTKISGVRKFTAEAMVTSARTIPHVTEFVTIDATASVELIDHLKTLPAFRDLKVTPLALVAKVVLAALRDHPTLNSAWDEEHQEIVTKHYVNLGIAVASPRGLLVPSVKDAEQLSLPELCAAIGTLAATARSGAATPADLRGGTFSITNIGVFGIDTGTPIINPGEAAILCLGAIRQRPWVFQGEVAVRWVTTLGLSFDHRLVDGEQGSKFLADVAAMMEDPLGLLGRL
ncbi:dihydrolipoamide acetyltransferase family protein [Antrihabitans stalactiti]|uniref:Dihydrolipoamide acetyltransferase component of pyruvate dehydrogenase complex n=1 Tax=Antrihabitans stalactiti TaxID=2584121 RepID=A0A848KIG3_9NOCA|nr:dihydrolipoamide acetyltransferase family protein [Antrihabitans stalactiti]NMN98863.1 2-oxo acid dehydrogenase subunit E2 [Antrihabitans stalactiti]